MRKKLKILMLFAFLGISLATTAQTLKGTIIDKQTGEPLVGANIVIKGTTQGTIANIDGSFVLTVTQDKITMEVSFVGYISQSVEVEMGGTDKDLGNIEMPADAIGLEELVVVASFAKDRSTPVAISNIQPEMIQEKLGAQEYPEILKSTPSIYATKAGGGFGDSRINMRGFDGNNIGVLINGVPVNDMEWGKVYWSNWAGLSDVTRTMQVQRGLGYSKLALSSVGGTINIITKSTDAEQGGSVYYGIGNDNLQKLNFTVSTGLTDKGWALTLSGGHTAGDGYVKGTNYESWSYFFNLSKRINDKQSLSLTAFGAPQWHNQRGGYNTIQNYRNNPDGIKYNPYTGFRNGKVYNTGYAYNVYHKPQISLNHYWDINSTTSLSTAVYMSIGRGGGRRLRGAKSSVLSVGYPSGDVSSTYQTPDGYLDFDRAIAENSTNINGSQIFTTIGTNEHDWYGLVSSFNTKIGNINLTAGIDGRYYKGYHTDVIEDLMGGDFAIFNDKNVNRDITGKLYKDDIVYRDYTGEVMWEGLFLQGEYVAGPFSAFLSSTMSYSSYRNTDRLHYVPAEQQTDWQNFIGYSFKGGLNYNINEYHNVFVNGGYFSKAPFYSYVFVSNNTINPDAKHENVLSTELGYGFKSKFIKANLTLYRTLWLNKSYAASVSVQDLEVAGGIRYDNINLEELDALHQGIELEVFMKPVKKIDIKIMCSLGDWKWNSDGNAVQTKESGELVSTSPVFSEGVHVGDAAQTTASFGFDAEVLPKFKIGIDYNYYARLFANFNVKDRTTSSETGQDSWEMPDYHLFDFNAKYSFKIGEVRAVWYANVNNLLDTEYFAEGYDGTQHNAESSYVYYGFGRTWSMGLKINF